MSNRLIQEIKLGDEVFDISDKTLDVRINAFQASVDNRIDAFEDDIDTQLNKIGFNFNRKFLFVADSYDEYGGWIDKCAGFLGLRKNIDYWNLGLSGSSFIDGRWLTQVKNWVASHPSEVANIGTIVCGGGINDATPPYTQTALAINMKAFSDYCHSTFTDIEIKLSWFGYVFDTSAWAGGRDKYQRTIAQQIWSRASEFNMTYMPGAEMVLHDRALVVDDALHPNAEGGKRIAGCVANQLVTGSCNVTNMGFASLENSGASISGNIRQVVFNNTDIVSFEDLTLINNTNTPWHFKDGAWQDISVCYLPFSNAMPEFNTIIQMQLADNTWVNAYCMIAVIGNILKIAVKDIDNTTGYLADLQVKRINSINLHVPISGIYE